MGAISNSGINQIPAERSSRTRRRRIEAKSTGFRPHAGTECMGQYRTRSGPVAHSEMIIPVKLPSGWVRRRLVIISCRHFLTRVELTLCPLLSPPPLSLIAFACCLRFFSAVREILKCNPAGPVPLSSLFSLRLVPPPPVALPPYHLDHQITKSPNPHLNDSVWYVDVSAGLARGSLRRVACLQSFVGDLGLLSSGRR